MLKAFPARALSYDARDDVARVEVAGAGEMAAGAPRTASALLLLDARGFLVGVDLGGEELERPVVLLGAYEKVDRTLAADVAVAYGPGGDPLEVKITGARARVRANEANPYLSSAAQTKKSG